jgi:endonuclease G
MSDQTDRLNSVKAANAAVERQDAALADEMRAMRERVRSAAPADGALESRPGAGRDQFVAETIVRRVGRPVLAIVHDQAALTFSDAESQVWKARLQSAATRLSAAARAVGRIEVEGHTLAWLGTGWIVAEDILVTNRHVAAEFARRNGTTFVFRQGFSGRPMSASIDFLEEVNRTASMVFQLGEIISIAEDEGPDVAFLRVTPVANSRIPQPIALAASPAQTNDLIAAMGYPAKDSRIPDQALMDSIFGDVYDKKRLSPGQIVSVSAGELRHDCSTLGGSSGSAIISLDTGAAVGLHFA